MACKKHYKFLSRTVLVQSSVEESLRLLNTILNKEGITELFHRNKFHEPRTETRRRVNFERCRAIYNEDMERKIKFLLRKNRKDPFPGCT